VNTLLTVPAARRAEIRVRQVAAPLSRCVLAAPDDRVTDLLEHAGAAAGGPILVLEDGRIVGMITSQDIMTLTRRPRPSQRPPTTRSPDHSY
jgi:CBS domain-containing protein